MVTSKLLGVHEQKMVSKCKKGIVYVGSKGLNRSSDISDENTVNCVHVKCYKKVTSK